MLTVFVVFIGSSTAGATFVKGVTLLEELTEFVEKAAGLLTGAENVNIIEKSRGTPVSDRIDDPHARSVLTSLGHLDETVIALGRAFGIEATDPIPSAGKG